MTTMQQALLKAGLIKKSNLDEHEKTQRWKDTVDRKMRREAKDAEAQASKGERTTASTEHDSSQMGESRQ